MPGDGMISPVEHPRFEPSGDHTYPPHGGLRSLREAWKPVQGVMGVAVGAGGHQFAIKP